MGQEARKDARRRHQADGGPGIGCAQQGEEFLQDPLGGQGDEAAGLGGAGGRGGGIRLAPPVAGQEAEVTEDAQMVLGDPLVRLADKGDPALPGRSKALAGGIEDPALPVCIEGVEGEVAASRVFGPVGREGHDGAATIGLHVPPQCGDLEAAPAADRGDGAMIQAGGDGLQAGGLQGRNHRCRLQPGGQVDVGDGAAHDRIPDAAADKARAVRTPCRLQGVDHRSGGGILQPGHAFKNEIRPCPAHAGAPNRRWDRTLSIPAVAPQMNRSSWVMA